MPEFTPSKPARVPYVFPPPGTNQVGSYHPQPPISMELLMICCLSLKVADKIRERRRNGELIDLDAVLFASCSCGFPSAILIAD